MIKKGGKCPPFLSWPYLDGVESAKKRVHQTVQWTVWREPRRSETKAGEVEQSETKNMPRACFCNSRHFNISIIFTEVTNKGIGAKAPLFYHGHVRTDLFPRKNGFIVFPFISLIYYLQLRLKLRNF